jgi:CubicO group peptidase (beta-lactamase class C family)
MRRHSRGAHATASVVSWFACLTAAVIVTIPVAGQGLPDAAVSGRYEFTADMAGRRLEGVIELQQDPTGGGISGELRLGSLPPAAVVAGTLSGSQLTLQLRLPEGPATLMMQLRDGAAFSGELRVQSRAIAIAGTKTRAAPPPPVDDFLAHVRRETDVLAPLALAAEAETGLAVAVVDDARRWIGGFGKRDRDREAAVTGTTIFQVGSISKLLTAWGVMRLVEQGLIGLDAPVNDHLKRWSLRGTQFDPQSVTVRRLLSHTAGINVPSISGVDHGDEIPDLLAELDGRGRGDEWSVRVVRQPGNAFMYSGGGYMVLQLLIEEVTGREFAEYMRAEVLLPLGMVNSFFGWNDTVARQVATPHSAAAERDRRHRLFAGLAAAGLYTTAEDLSLLLAAHLPGAQGETAGRGVIRPETLDAMLRPDPVARTYGLGYEIRSTDGGSFAGHGGSNIGWKANLFVAPDLRIGFAVLSNDDAGNARAAVLETALDAAARMIRSPNSGRQQ